MLLRQIVADAGINEFTFQWAPTLGGECYTLQMGEYMVVSLKRFQWAPTLGGECYALRLASPLSDEWFETAFQRAPTLGGECYIAERIGLPDHPDLAFQWAPTLGGECYNI